MDPALHLCPEGWAVQYLCCTYLIVSTSYGSVPYGSVEACTPFVFITKALTVCISSVPAGLWIWGGHLWWSASELLNQREHQRWTCHLLTGKKTNKTNKLCIKDKMIRSISGFAAFLSFMVFGLLARQNNITFFAVNVFCCLKDPMIYWLGSCSPTVHFRVFYSGKSSHFTPKWQITPLRIYVCIFFQLYCPDVVISHVFRAFL